MSLQEAAIAAAEAELRNWNDEELNGIVGTKSR
jgi:hypothetical protein